MNKNIGLWLIFGGVIALISILYFTYFREVTVTFGAKIGAGVAPVNVRVGNTIAEPTLPENDEYKFIGWYKDGEKFDFNTPIKEDTYLEAKWEKIEK